MHGRIDGFQQLPRVIRLVKKSCCTYPLGFVPQYRIRTGRNARKLFRIETGQRARVHQNRVFDYGLLDYGGKKGSLIPGALIE